MEELPGDPNASEQGPPTMEDLMNDDFSTTSYTQKRQASLVNIASIRILTANEIGRVKTKFLEEADMALAEAIRAHVSVIIVRLTLYTCVEKHSIVRGAHLALGSPSLVRLRQRCWLLNEPNHLLPVHPALWRGCHPALTRHPQAPDRLGPATGQDDCERGASQDPASIQALRNLSLRMLKLSQ